MSLRDVITKVEEQYGTGSVAQGSRGRSFTLARFTSTIFDLDRIVGGGWPHGRFIQIYGPPSGGKSVVVMKSIAGQQKYCRYCYGMFMPDETTGELLCACPKDCEDCGKTFAKKPYDGPEPKEGDPFNWEVIWDEWSCECLVEGATKKKSDRVPKTTRRAARCRQALFDAENSFTKEWAIYMGVDPDLLFVFVPEYAEQGIDIADTLLRSTEIDALAVDSVAELTPSKEIESSTEEWQMGLQARLVNKALRKWNASVNSLGVNSPRKPTVFLINQTRTNMQGEEVCPGGWAQQFKASIRLRMNAAHYKFKEQANEKDRDDPKKKELQYADIGGFTRKNKTFAPMKTFASRLYLDNFEGNIAGSTNEYGVVFDRALELEVIGNPKDGKYTYGSRSWNTQRQVKTDLEAEPILFWEIRSKALALALTVMA